MSYVLSVFPSGRGARLLALVILMAALGAAVFAGTMLGGAPPATEAAPAGAPSAQMGAVSMYIQFVINGNTVIGDVTRGGFEEWSEVYSFGHSATVPHEAATGMATGRVQFNAVTVTKAIDSSSPLLLQALLENQVFDAEIKIQTPSVAGMEQLALQYVLTGGRILGHRINATVDNTIDTETLSLSFSTFQMTWADGGIEAHYEAAGE